MRLKIYIFKIQWKILYDDKSEGKYCYCSKADGKTKLLWARNVLNIATPFQTRLLKNIFINHNLLIRLQIFRWEVQGAVIKKSQFFKKKFT